MKDAIRKRTHSEAYFPLSSLHFQFNLKLHSRAQLIGLVGTAEVLHEGEAKLPSCTGAASGEDVAIHSHLVGSVLGTLHGALKAGIAGGSLALKQTKAAKHERRSTDGRDE